MNEVTKIHLGNQAFTISVDAYHELKKYLAAIKEQVKDADVVNEIELRMAELLIEHGVNANKVILQDDVDFLKHQLGNPKDFKEDEDESQADGDKQSTGRRLFRDTDNAMIAGVAAGLSKYFGVDVLLMRILFVITVLITFGWGVLIYILLWLLVPEAKTSSDRLMMAGKPVTVDSIKEIVERADVKGAAHRANATLSGPINSLFRTILKIIGLVFMIFGLSVFFGLIAAETYFLLHNGTWLQYNIFPVGLREHILLDMAMAIAAIVALFLILFGIAMFRRKWPIRNWVTGVLIGLGLICMAVGGSIAADVYPNIRDRYNANVHTTIRAVEPFTAVNAGASGVDINFAYSSNYYISLNYYDHPDLSSIKTIVRGGVLNIDSSQFNWRRNCQEVCIPDTYDMIITIYSPIATQFKGQDIGPMGPPVPVFQQ
jgi:phage shock protein PspC (stress-responsive transcriptional regulator)